MKKALKVFGAIIIVLIVAAIVIPFIFNDEIKTEVVKVINENINATVDFDDVELSLFKNFPSLAISLEDIVVINKEPFKGDTLFSASSIGATVNLMSVISGDKISVKSVYFDSPKVIAYILEDGSANYNITKDEKIVKGKDKTDTSVESTNFKIELESYRITNGNIAYVDQMSGMLLALKNLNHSGEGNFTQDDFILETKTSIDEMTFEMDGIKYLNKVKSSLDMQLGVNLPNMKITFNENKIVINNLELKFGGNITMPKEDINIDVNFSSPSNSFKDIISLIPIIYKNDFASLETSGKMSLVGNVKGTMNENSLPAFNIDLTVNKGKIKYPDFPTSINNVNLLLKVKNNDGVIDNTIVDLSKIHLELGSEPIDGKVIIKNIETGPNVDVSVKGKIDLANLKSTLEFDNIERLEGIINSDFRMNGNIASAQKNYEKVNASGEISVVGLNYKRKDFDQMVNISNALLKFNPKNVSLDNFTAKIGGSDIKANGYLNNLISYVMSDGILKGRLNVSSNYFDFNPYLREGEENTTNKKSDKEIETVAFDVPENINFNMKSNFKKLIYDNLELTNVTGDIIVKDSKVNLTNLKMNLLDGEMSGSGYYSKTKFQDNPEIKFDLNIKDFNIKKTFNSFVSVAQIAPITKYIKGNFSSKLSMNTSLDNSMMPVWETFFSNGFLNLKTAEINGFKPFTTVGNMLKLKELSNPKLSNVNPKFEIKKGRFYVKPFDFKVGNYNVVISGSNGIDQSIDYKMDIKVPVSKLKNKANSAIGGLIGKDLNLVKSETVNVQAFIGGTVNSPKVKTTATDVATNIVSDVTSNITDQAKAQVEKAKADAERKLKEEAKKKEEELKKKLENEAKKKLKKLFKWG